MTQITNPIISGVRIGFPATEVPSADVNTVDDYEEGTWSPTATSFTIGGGGGTPTTSGTYTKIGRLVFFTARIAPNGGTIASVAGSSRLAGLPWTTAADVTAAWSDQTDAVTISGVNIVTGTQAYAPAWAASTHAVIVSGAYPV